MQLRSQVAINHGLSDPGRTVKPFTSHSKQRRADDALVHLALDALQNAVHVIQQVQQQLLRLRALNHHRLNTSSSTGLSNRDPLLPPSRNLVRLASMHVAWATAHNLVTAPFTSRFASGRALRSQRIRQHATSPAQHAPNGAHLFTEQGRGVNALVTGVVCALWEQPAGQHPKRQPPSGHEQP
jgi:hypothetical protein